MRFLGWVGLAAVLATVGCSGGGSTTSSAGGGSNNGNNNNNNNGGGGITQTTFNFSVPNFNATKQATLMRRNMPGSESFGNASINSNTVNKLDPNAQEPGRDLPPDLIARDLEQIRSAPSVGRISVKFQQIAKGADQNFFIVTTSQTVTCRKMLAENQTQHCTVFAQVVGGNPIIDETRALAIQNAWDVDNGTGQGIYNLDRSIFGSEWDNAGGRDGDSKVNLVILNSSGIGGSGFFGFTRPGDEEVGGNSNQGEILYLNNDKFGADGFDMFSTMAHEFQHLIALNTKRIHQGAFDGQQENAAIDEGKSVLAEDLAGYGLDAAGGGNGFTYQACRAFLNAPGAQGLFSFNSNLDSYGRDYVFMRYLVDRFGLPAFSSYAKSSGTGLAQLNASFGSLSSLFTDWTNALVASPLGGSVPGNLRFTGPFQPGRTYPQIRGFVGAQTLPTLQPAQTVAPPSGTQNINLTPWAFSPVLYRNGTGNTLSIQVVGDSTQGASLVVENPTGTFGGVQ
ncbi:hypothetical protein JST97_32585 [bacterium]|nr:hypothetical protein [bacterium]